jgi:hypothetical protein
MIRFCGVMEFYGGPFPHATQFIWVMDKVELVVILIWSVWLIMGRRVLSVIGSDELRGYLWEERITVNSNLDKFLLESDNVDGGVPMVVARVVIAVASRYLNGQLRQSGFARISVGQYTGKQRGY